jgi:hypothetical protein
MFITLKRFSSIEELAPVFEHGGQVTFVPIMVYPGICIVRGKDHPWEIILRVLATKGLSDQKETLLHEFVHLFHNSGDGYSINPRETRIFNETEVNRQTKRLLKHNPKIVDEITKELILRPNCSIMFPSDEDVNPFREYYQSLVNEIVK